VRGHFKSPRCHSQSLANLTSLTTSDLGRMLEIRTGWIRIFEFLQSPALRGRGLMFCHFLYGSLGISFRLPLPFSLVWDLSGCVFFVMAVGRTRNLGTRLPHIWTGTVSQSILLLYHHITISSFHSCYAFLIDHVQFR